jgi:hypothetical protein
MRFSYRLRFFIPHSYTACLCISPKLPVPQACLGSGRSVEVVGGDSIEHSDECGPCKVVGVVVGVVAWGGSGELVRGVLGYFRIGQAQRSRCLGRDLDVAGFLQVEHPHEGLGGDSPTVSRPWFRRIRAG